MSDTTVISSMLEQFGIDMGLVHEWAQGDASHSVTLGGVATPSIRNLVAGLIDGGGVVAYQTKAELNADLAHAENTLAFVTNDETASNLGWYIKVGASGTGSWKQSTYDRTVTQAQLASYLHGVSLITSSNAQEICGGDADKLAPHTIYIYNRAAQIANIPEYANGLILSLSRSGSSSRLDGGAIASGSIQMFITTNGDMYWRDFGNVNTSWHKALREEDKGNLLHGEIFITQSTAQAFCEGDADKIPVNTICRYSYDANLEHMPVSGSSNSYNGQIITLSSESSGYSSASMQMYINYSGGFYVRFYATSTWQPWFKIAAESDLNAYVKSTGVLITADNAQDECEGSLGNLPTGTICSASSASGLNDLPVKRNGLVTTLSRAASRQTPSTGYAVTSSQFYMTTEHYFYRYYSNGWLKWRTNVPMDCMNILGVGDSICYGGRNGYKGFVGELGMPYANYGKSGWRLSSGSDNGPIASQLDAFAADAADSTKSVYGFVPDVIIGEGGINDYSHDIPLGTVPTEPVNPSDTTTVIGGLQLLFYKMITMYPYAQRLFVLVHKMGKADGSKYYPTDANSAGYTQEDMVEAIIATCRVYGVKPVDVYHEGQMDTKFDVYLGDWAADNDSPAWCNIDRCHPLHNGYVNVYVPLIWQALAGGTKKE